MYISRAHAVPCVLQYGRQNIENVRKRNGTRSHPDGEVGAEEERGSPAIHESSSTVTSSGKTQNGSVGNTVIARSKDSILVPDAENQKNHVEKTKLKNDDETSSTVDGKEVK